MPTVSSPVEPALGLSVSVNGGAFVTASGANIPAGLPGLFDLGQITGDNSFLNSDVLWAATGTGTLSNADAATLNGFANTDPALASIPGTPALLWTADSPADTTSTTTETTSYQYDNAGRLSHVSYPSGLSRDYAYDADSNRTTLTDNGVQTGSCTYNPAITAGVDQLTSTLVSGTTTGYSYGTDGQVLTKGTDTLSWDGRGRNIGGSFAGTTVTNTYEPAGLIRQRTAATTTTDYLLDGQIETVAATITTFAVTGPAGDLAHYDGPPTTATPTYLSYNGHGDLAAQLTGTQTTPTSTNTFRYDPFGTPTPTPTGTSTTERFVAAWNKKLDPTSGLINMGARPYDPTLGRFLTTDPIDNGSLNNYDYTAQDPINNYDLNGTMLDKNGIGDCESGSCGNTFDTNPTGVASVGHIASGAIQLGATGTVGVFAAGAVLELAPAAGPVAVRGAFLARAATVATAQVAAASWRVYGPSVVVAWAAAQKAYQDTPSGLPLWGESAVFVTQFVRTFIRTTRRP